MLPSTVPLYVGIRDRVISIESPTFYRRAAVPQITLNIEQITCNIIVGHHAPEFILFLRRLFDIAGHFMLRHHN